MACKTDILKQEFFLGFKRFFVGFAIYYVI